MDATASLQCVMFTDMAASTATMVEHGPGAALDLRRAHDDIVHSAIAGHDGVVVDTNGDGVMAMFGAASAAVAAAVRIHEALRDHGLRADTVEPVRVRIGLAVGEVRSDDGRHIGDAVVQAARLEASAEPGTTRATDLVAVLARDVDHVEFAEHHHRDLKGFPEPVAVCTVRPLRRRVGPIALPKALLDPSASRLVGRAEATARLWGHWEEARSGRFRVGAVTGEAGAGKSRLLAEIAARGHLDEAIVLHGTADPELDIPYQAMADALRSAADLDPDLAHALDGDTDAGPLARLFPRAGSSDDVAIERREVFTSTAAALRRLADIRPLLVVLDDLHWARSSTTQLLQAVAPHLQDARILVLAGYRSSEIDAGHPMSTLLADPHIASVADRVDLDPLSPTDVEQLAAEQVGRELDPPEIELAHRIHRECGGSPFYVSEVLRHLRAVADVFAPGAASGDAGAADELPIPATVRDVVIRRVEALGDDGRRLLTAAAVAGPSFDPDVVAEATGIDPDDALDVFEAAMRASLCRPQIGGRVGFSHDIVRHALTEALSPTRLVRLHGRLARALEETHTGTLDELVRHWTAASSAGDDDRALHYLGLAAERDERALAWETAAERYEHMLTRIEEHADADDRRAAGLWLSLGRARREAGDPAYRDAMVEAGRLGRRLGDADVVARSAIGFLRSGGWFVDATYTDERMIGLSEQALEMLPADDPLRVRVLAGLATVSPYAHTTPGRQAMADESLALARRLGDPSLLVAALTSVHMTHWSPHHLARRLSVAEELRSTAERLDDAGARFLGRMFLELARLESTATITADTIDDLADLATGAGSFWFEFLVERLRNAVTSASATEDPRPAIDALFNRANGTLADATGTWAAQHAEVARQAGRFGDMVGALVGAADRAGPQGIWGYSLVIALVAAGDLDEAARRIDQVEVEPNQDYMWLVTMQMFAEAAYRTGRADLCARIHDELAPFPDSIGMIASGTVIWGPVSLSLAFAAAGAGRLELVRDHLVRAREIAERLPMPYAVTQADELEATLG